MAPASSYVSEGTISVLKDLLRDAETGKLIGIAFISVERGRRPDFGWSGYAGQDPNFTLGAIDQLHDIMLEKAKEKYRMR